MEALGEAGRRHPFAIDHPQEGAELRRFPALGIVGTHHLLPLCDSVVPPSCVQEWMQVLYKLEYPNLDWPGI
eukprot:4945957-Pyramimonas_sp.AAC.1